MTVHLRTSPTPYFALSWMLTLFSHDINTLEPVQRIFDFLLSRNPAAVIYLGVAVSKESEGIRGLRLTKVTRRSYC